MKKYALSPFVVGKVFFATKDAYPNFQIDITTQESIVFFESDVYACYMVHRKIKDRLIKSGLKGFHFPNTDLCKLEYSFKNRESFDKQSKPLPNWEWIVFSEDQSDENDVYINDIGEIICDDAFLKILRTRSLNKDRTIVKDIKIESNTEKDDDEDMLVRSIDIYKKEKGFNPALFCVIFFIAILVGIILFA